MIKVSIIVPCYNCEEFIGKCINSILNQSYKNIELILINDGSTDNSELIIKSYLTKDNRIKYLYQNNKGVSEARNLGIKNCAGDYLMFVDGDDTIESNYIECFVKKASDSPSMIVGGFTYCFQNGSVSVIPGIEFNKMNISEYIDNYYINSISSRILFGPINKLYKVSLLKKNDILFKRNISIREDGLFVLDCLRSCKTIAGIKNSGYNYYQQNVGESLVTKFNNEELKVNALLFNTILSFVLDKSSIEVVNKIYPIFLNMDYSSIRKLYFSKEYHFFKGLKYIYKVKNDPMYRYARKLLLKQNLKKGLKYFRPVILIHYINYTKRIQSKIKMKFDK